MTETISAPVVAINIEGLTRSFGVQMALKGIDLQVTQGESVVILGPNGAGKTTLLKIMATIMTPSSGKIQVFGLDTKTDAEKIRNLVGVVMHQCFFTPT